MSTAPGGEQPPQPVLPPAAEMAAALARPAPVPANADAVEQFRRSIDEFMPKEENVVIPAAFAAEGARVGIAALAELTADAALPGALDAVFSRTGVHSRLMCLHIRNALKSYREREAEPLLAEARSCV